MPAVDSKEDAVKYAKKLKKAYGNGVSSQIVIVNNSSLPLKLMSDDHISGRFEWDPPEEIPAKKVGYFLHVKRSSTVCGSMGCVEYGFVDFFGSTKAIFGWDTPHSGTNCLGVELFGFAATADDKKKIMQQNTGNWVAQHFDEDKQTKYVIEAKFDHNESSVRIIYTLKEEKKKESQAPPTKDEPPNKKMKHTEDKINIKKPN